MRQFVNSESHRRNGDGSPFFRDPGIRNCRFLVFARRWIERELQQNPQASEFESHVTAGNKLIREQPTSLSDRPLRVHGRHEVYLNPPPRWGKTPPTAQELCCSSTGTTIAEAGQTTTPTAKEPHLGCTPHCVTDRG